MAQSDILKACNAILNTLPAFPVAWQNGQTDPVTTHYRQSFLPAGIENISIGYRGSQKLTGIYQVLVAIPKNTGLADVVVGESDLLAKFSRGTTLNFNGQTAEVDRIDIAEGFNDGEWFMAPCSIYYEGFTHG